MVPVWLTAFVDIVTDDVVPLPFMIRLPAVPAVPPVSVSALVSVGTRVRLLFKVMSELNVQATLLVIVDVPILPEATVIGLV